MPDANFFRLDEYNSRKFNVHCQYCACYLSNITDQEILDLCQDTECTHERDMWSGNRCEVFMPCDDTVAQCNSCNGWKWVKDLNHGKCESCIETDEWYAELLAEEEEERRKEQEAKDNEEEFCEACEAIFPKQEATLIAKADRVNYPDLREAEGDGPWPVCFHCNGQSIHYGSQY